MAGFVAAARFIVPMRFKETRVQMAQRRVLDRLLEQGLQIGTGKRPDAVIAKPFGDADERENARHGSSRFVAKQQLALFDGRKKRHTELIGVNGLNGVSLSGELRGPSRDCLRTIARPQWQVLLPRVQSAVEQRVPPANARRVRLLR